MLQPINPGNHLVTMRIFCIAATLATVTLSACGDAAEGDAIAPVVRDSAGIQLVENSGSAWAEGAGWRLSEDPVLEIGRAAGAAEYLLDRIAGARRLADGRLVIANGGSGELRYYGPDGAHLRSVGGIGEGPREFRGMQWLRPYGVDSLMIFDQALQRISTMGLEGEFGRVVSLSALGPAGRANPQGVFSDGVILGNQRVRFEERSGFQQSDAIYGLFAGLDGSMTDTLAITPGLEFYQIREPSMVMVTSRLLVPEPHVTVSGNRAFVGFGGTYEIQEYDSQGTLHRLIRNSVAPSPVSPTDLDRLVELQLAMVKAGVVKDRISKAFDELPRPDFRPAFSGLMGDDDGNLWVQESRLPWEPESWQVFDPDGRLLGPVEMPVGFRPLHISADFVVGVSNDELDIQQVQSYALEKPER